MKNNMLLRAISGSIYVAVIVCCIIFGLRSFTLLMAIFGVIGINEVVTMFTRGQAISRVAQYVDLLFFAALIVGLYFVFLFLEVPATVCAIVAVAYLPVRMVLAVCDKKGSALRQVAGAFFGFLYIAAPLLLLLCVYGALGVGYTSKAILLMTFILIWLNDTGAYLSGRTFGKTKLCERLSPKKTWEGFWGGFALCIVASVVYAFISHDNPIVYGIYGALVSVASTYGDLFESLIKRKCGVKDSGTLIPGHGGILDRIDSFLAVAPLAALFLIYSA